MSDAPDSAKANISLPAKIVPGTKRIFTDEFRNHAITRARASKEPIAVTARALGIHESILRRWLSGRPKKPDKKTGPHGGKRTKADRRELVRRWQAGESAEAVAREAGVTASALTYWKQSLNMGAAPRTLKANGNGVAFGGQAPVAPSVATSDAIRLLRLAKTEMHGLLQRGVIKEFDQAHLLTLLALNTLIAGSG